MEYYETIQFKYKTLITWGKCSLYNTNDKKQEESYETKFTRDNGKKIMPKANIRETTFFHRNVDTCEISVVGCINSFFLLLSHMIHMLKNEISPVNFVFEWLEGGVCTF